MPTLSPVTAKDTKEPTNKRRWLAVMLATLLMVMSHILFIYALVAASGDEVVFAGALLGIGVGLVPAVFAVAAFVSQNERSFVSTMAASALWLVFAVLIGLGNVPTGLVAGYGAGGVVAFRLGPKHTRGARVVAVALTIVYTLVLQRILPEVGLFAGAPLPFLAVAIADIYKERFGEEEPLAG